MSLPGLTPANLRHFAILLRNAREEATRELARLETTMSGIRDARKGADADDEHDPEGPTMSFEWSRITGLQDQSVDELAAIDRALERLTAGAYGLCLRCAQPISSARLDARPAAELCIDCARLQDARR